MLLQADVLKLLAMIIHSFKILFYFYLLCFNTSKVTKSSSTLSAHSSYVTMLFTIKEISLYTQMCRQMHSVVFRALVI